MTEFQIKLAETPEEIEAAHALRYERLRQPLGQAPGSELDPAMEEFSTQAIALEGDTVVGVAVWLALPTAHGMRIRARQLVVAPTHEASGVGKALNVFMEQQARAIGAVEMEGAVRVDRISYFEARGWEVSGESPTLFGTVEQVTMIRRLT